MIETTVTIKYDIKEQTEDRVWGQVDVENHAT